MKFFISEFIGTFILVLSILVTADPIFITAAFLCAITIASASAGHINPIVSLVMALSGKINYIQAFEYLIGQVIGGTFAFLVYTFLGTYK